MFILNTKFKLKYYLKVCKYFSIFFQNKRVQKCACSYTSYTCSILIHCFLEYIQRIAIGEVQEYNEVHQWFKCFLNLLRILGFF